MKMKAHSRPLLMAASVLAISCGSGGGDTRLPTGSKYDFGPILDDSVQKVIIPTYKDLLDHATLLTERVKAIETDADLKAAQAQWRATRVHWELTEAYMFGPVTDLGLDPALDSWPVDRVQLEQVLASGLALTSESIAANLGGGLKGFHTIEYLLFGENSTRTAAALTANRRENQYLAAVTEALRNDAETLHHAWTSEADDFGRTFQLSGQPGGRYYNQVDAIQQLVNGCIEIADEVANGKIADPFKEQNPELEESRFSFNSIEDFAHNIQGIRDIYTGRGGSKGISSYVAEKNPALDQRTRTEIQAAIDAIRAISPDNDPPFGKAMLDPAMAPRIEAAQEAIRKVRQTLIADVTATFLK